MIKNIFLILTILISILYACNNESSTKKNNKTDSLKTTSLDNSLIIVAGANITGNLTLNQEIEISIDAKKKEEIDSVQIIINDKYYSTLVEIPSTFIWNSSESKTGANNINAVGYWQGKTIRSLKTVVLFSNLKPEIKKYKIVNTYHHDKEAYTQGLFIHKGILYEATGLKGHSTIRKTKLESGDVIQSYTISQDIFGEGITLFNNNIIQLSWQDQIAYIYDFETFKQIGEFEYYTEGWGLTNDGTNLIMSDGSNKLYFIENQSYSIINQLEVYDNEKSVVNLNELEYIDGIIYANIYTSDKIVAIDAETGKVMFYVDLSNLLSENEIDSETDVLNGIAYDFDKNKLYVTGKKWPKLFEIEISGI
jgi:glutamine cyclotransferase